VRSRFPCGLGHTDFVRWITGGILADAKLTAVCRFCDFW
jgi:hypothetical protein